jgi:hypothetical protein
MDLIENKKVRNAGHVFFFCGYVRRSPEIKSPPSLFTSHSVSDGWKASVGEGGDRGIRTFGFFRFDAFKMQSVVSKSSPSHSLWSLKALRKFFRL